MESQNIADMNDAQFLRHIAHTAEIGDPIEGRWIERMRDIAMNIEHTIAVANGEIG